MEEPKATSKHTLCGYSWGDVSSSLQRAIGISDMNRSQRWAAELVCSDLGLGRLEALLFHTWAIHVGHTLPGWAKDWLQTIRKLRELWSKSGQDIKVIRNTPIIRQLIAESVANLVLAQKNHLPTLPTSVDVFREAETIRARIRSGNGSGNQRIIQNIWSPQYDGEDIRTIGNELEASMRTNHLHRTLFWIIWVITLDAQTDVPSIKERGPVHLPVKQRKSILWFYITLLKELANEFAYLSTEDRNGLFETLEITWMKLGKNGRRDIIVAIAIAIQEHIAKKNSLTISNQVKIPDQVAIRSAVASLDDIYKGIAEEAKRFIIESPTIVGLTKEATVPKKTNKILSPNEKLSLAYSLLHSRQL